MIRRIDPPRVSFAALKTLVVSLIFLPLAAVILAVPLVRLLVPVWPAPVEERLDVDGRPVLALAESGGSPAEEPGRSALRSSIASKVTR